MTILFMGSDLSSFESSTGNSSEFTGINFRGPMPFTGLGVRTEKTVGEYTETPAWASADDIWIHLVTRSGTYEPIHIMDGSTVVFRMQSVTGGYQFSYLSAPATYTNIGPVFTIDSEWNYYDIHVTFGVSGQVTLYMNDVERMPSATADMSYISGSTSLRFTGSNTTDAGGVVVADEPTIGWRLGRLAPLANGANTAWTGGFENIDETTLNAADYIYTGTADLVETYTQTPTPDATGYIPRAVAVSAYGRRGASGPTGLQLALRSGSTNYFSSTKSLGLGFTGNLEIWETNPDTGLAWTSSQLAALQIGVKSIA